MNHMKVSHMRGFADDERASYQGTVRNNVLDVVESMASISESEYPGLDVAAKFHAELLSRELASWEARPKNITFEVANAVQSLWQNETLKSAMFDASDINVSKSAPYFVKEIHRIAEEDYIPTETDILMAKTIPSGIREYKFSLESLGVHMISIGDHRSDMKKFIHQFENVTSIIYSVDLGGYDQCLPTDSNRNMLIESLQTFGSVVNSRWFLRTSIILLLCNAGLFSWKLGRSPMSSHFPDYSGGNDVGQASKYIVWRFNQLNRKNLSLFPHLCEASDTSNIQVIFAASKDTMIFNAMQDSGIPVERKNSATSTTSSSRKGSNDRATGDEKE
ncbi:guanine nucleotide binding protein, alpha subunit [Stipitochalara longipes BDJ]|nr:guanine nucleotide binding protein, alpha subunit [Stipitochalara longipes BDJ]